MANALDREFDAGLIRLGVLDTPHQGRFVTYRFEVDGRPFSATREHSHSKNRSEVSRYRIETPVRRPAEGAADAAVIEELRPIVLEPETSRTRLAVSLGLAHDARTGDASFDAVAFVESLSDDATVARLFTPPARDAVRALLARCVDRIVVHGEPDATIAIEVRGSVAPSDVFSDGRLETLIHELARLAEAMPPVRRLVSKPSVARVSLVVALLVLGVAGLAMKIGEVIHVTRFGFLAHRQLEVMGGLAAFLVIAAWLANRKRPMAIQFFTGCALAGAVCGPLAVDGTVGVLNILLDTPRAAKGVVMRQVTVKKGNDPKVDVSVEARSAQYTVPQVQWASLTPGTPVEVEVGDGALGIPWYRNDVLLFASPRDGE